MWRVEVGYMLEVTMVRRDRKKSFAHGAQVSKRMEVKTKEKNTLILKSGQIMEVSIEADT